MKGFVGDEIIRSIHAEHTRLMHRGPTSSLVSVKINLAVAMLNYANSLESNYVGYTTLYKNSEKILLSVLSLDPGNDAAISNLVTVRKNLQMREFHAFQETRLYNPHVTLISRERCRQVVLRRYNVQLLSSTLFTCDNHTNMGLIWTQESQELEVEEVTNIWAKRALRVHHFQIYDARSLLWNEDFCWISNGGGWTKGPIYMLFHCIALDSFLAQMRRSARKKMLLPILQVRGGPIQSDRKGIVEKNWSPFVVNGVLYIVYSCRPLIVLQCDWESEVGLLRCKTVQETSTSTVYGALKFVQADLRGSSTGLMLRSQAPTSEFLYLGHVFSGARSKEYKFFFYKLRGARPPFRVVGCTQLFRLPSRPGSYQYGHGISIDGGLVVVSFGVDDAESWFVRIPLEAVEKMLAATDDRPEVPWPGSGAEKYPAKLFGGGMRSNLDAMAASLEASGNPLASDFLQFLRSVPNVTLGSCFARIARQQRLLDETTRSFDERARACEGRGGPALPEVDCGAAAVAALLDDALNAFWAFATVLSRENRIVQDIFDTLSARQPGSDPWVVPHDPTDGPPDAELMEAARPAGAVAGGPAAVGSKNPYRGEDGSGLDYSEALRRAMQGETGRDVMEAIRGEHDRAERAGAPHLVDVKINLAVALLRTANQDPDPASYGRAYQQSEELLAAALALHPGHGGVAANLEAVRRSRQVRSGAHNEGTALGTSTEDAGPPPAAAPSAPPVKEILAAPAAVTEQGGMSYQDALQQAMRGQKFVTAEVVEAMRKEHTRAVQLGDFGHIVTTRMNLGVALQNLGNEVGARDNVRLTMLYKESRDTLRAALAMEPGNAMILSNLEVVRKNVAKRDEFQLFNPHVTHVGAAACGHTVLRRLMQEQLSATLFTCDGHTDRGLLWAFESEEVDEATWTASYRDRRYFHRAPAHDVRSLVWNDSLCWISSGWDTSVIYMLFHCVPIDSFLDQMERSRRRGQLLPLLRARGGAILTDRKTLLEKNWSPFVAGGTLYITYSANPHIVKRCNWDEASGRGLLRCMTVQTTPVELPTSLAGMRAELRGSSTAIALPSSGRGGSEAEYLAMGHIRGAHLPTQYMYFFYRFRGAAPPFLMDGFSAAFSLPPHNGSAIQYGHGVCIEGDELLVTYGVEDTTAWHIRVPLREVMMMIMISALR